MTWRRVQVNNNLTISGNGANNVGEAAVYGWKSLDPNVVIAELANNNEGGSGIHGYYQVASRVWDNGNGTWDYIYVVNNQNSTQGADSFSIPAGTGLNLTNVWFNDVDYHSGELQNGTDWVMTQGSGEIRWDCTESFAQNPNANAINWHTSF